jgi:hypothetical protein
MSHELLNEKRTLLSMARAFRTDIQDIQQKGAGYYSCDPFVRRYNHLLLKTRHLYSDTGTVLLDSFEEIDGTGSVDPADKMKVTQRVIIELGQLIAFMESVIKQEETRRSPDARPSPQEEIPQAAAGKEDSNTKG